MDKAIIVIVVPDTVNILAVCGFPSSKINKFLKLVIIVSLWLLVKMSGLSSISVSELNSLSIVSDQSWGIVCAAILLVLFSF